MRRRLSLLIAALACATCGTGRDTAQPATTDEAPLPWLAYANVRDAGFDEQALRAVCERADRARSGALMAVFRGRVLLACGDVSRPLELHSVRKSVVSALYGTAVARGAVDLDSTLADLGIDDDTPLTAAERAASIRQLISARSGVYLPAAYAPASQSERPDRGSHPPGTHWFYNNWDFNVAGVIYERATGEDLYASFERRLAEPLGMEDWAPSHGFRVYEPTKSRHPAHTFRLSARDLARVGQLYLQRGWWAGRRLLTSDWVAESTRPHTQNPDGSGYAFMWWTYRGGSESNAEYRELGKHTFYQGLGTGGQGLWVIPGAELVVVHRADTDHGRGVDGEDHWGLVEDILAARRGPPTPDHALRALRPTPLSSQLPAIALPEDRPLERSVLADYLGDYRLATGATMKIGSHELTPAGTVRFFLFDEKLYVHLPGVGDGRLFPVDRDIFTPRTLPALRIAFERGGDGRPVTLSIAFAEQTVRASRVPGS